MEQPGVEFDEGWLGDVGAVGAGRQRGKFAFLLVTALHVTLEGVPGARGEPAQRATQGLGAVPPLQQDRRERERERRRGRERAYLKHSPLAGFREQSPVSTSQPNPLCSGVIGVKLLSIMIKHAVDLG